MKTILTALLCLALLPALRAQDSTPDAVAAVRRAVSKPPIIPNPVNRDGVVSTNSAVTVTNFPITWKHLNYPLPDPSTIVLTRPTLLARQDALIERQPDIEVHRLRKADMIRKMDETLKESIRVYCTNWNQRLMYRQAVAFWTTNHLRMVDNNLIYVPEPPPTNQVYESPVVELTADDEKQIQASIAMSYFIEKQNREEAAAKAAFFKALERPKTNSTP